MTPSALLMKSYEVAADAHKHQRRKTGEPYVTHCVETCNILARLINSKVGDESVIERGFEGMFGPNESNLIAAAMLHDTVEDTDLTLEDIEKIFGAEVAEMVDGVTKLNKINALTRTRTADPEKEPPVAAATSSLPRGNADYLRKIFLSMARDVRVILIKLADRLHNMRTLQGLSRPKQIKIAQETLDIFAPLASRLGIGLVEAELEDLCFQYLHPTLHEELAGQAAAREAESASYRERVERTLKARLHEEHVLSDIQAVPKRLQRIHQVMAATGKDFEQVYDVETIRILVPTARDCYIALGVVHNLWKPIPGELHDYIANAKNNHYQALHSTVCGLDGKLICVRICTREMFYLAQYGIAAHWRYQSELAVLSSGDSRELRWLRSVLDWKTGDGLFDAEEFMKSVRSDILPERAIVFTPSGATVELPLGATPIDYAYEVGGTGLGHRARGARVNGQFVPLNYCLKDGDQVEIMTSKSALRGPRLAWLNPHLNYVHTQRARAGIRSYFALQDESLNVVEGLNELERELTMLGVRYRPAPVTRLLRACRPQAPSLGEEAEAAAEEEDGEEQGVPDVLGHIAAEHGFARDMRGRVELLAAIGRGEISAQTAGAGAFDRQWATDEFPAAEEAAAAAEDPAEEPAPGAAALSIRGVGSFAPKLAKCCDPFPGDDVVGHLTRGGRFVAIHRRACKNILAKENTEHFIKVEWGADRQRHRPVRVLVKAFDRDGLLSDVVSIVAQEKVNMSECQSSCAEGVCSTAQIRAVLEVKSGHQLARILHLISHLPNVQYACRPYRNDAANIPLNAWNKIQ
eukprot:tig00000545_g2004.t1